jgi:prepilin-type N-terminal cleavage/methylation domain-containing protein
MRDNRGFTLIELLIAVNLSLLLINIILMSLSVAKPPNARIGLRQNLNGIYQLRQKLALCRVTKVEKNGLTCSFNQAEYVFSFEKNRLVMKPGYVVYLEGIINGRLELVEHRLSISFQVEGEDVDAVLAYID